MFIPAQPASPMMITRVYLIITSIYPNNSNTINRNGDTFIPGSTSNRGSSVSPQELLVMIFLLGIILLSVFFIVVAIGRTFRFIRVTLWKGAFRRRANKTTKQRPSAASTQT